MGRKHSVVIRGSIQSDGAFTPADRVNVRDEFKCLAGEQVLLTVKRMSDRRSAQANNYYWGVLVKSVSEHTGYTPQEVHALFKQMFASEVMHLTRKDNTVAQVTVPKSTAYMDKAEHTQFLQQCTALALDLGCRLPAEEGIEYHERV